MTKNIFENKVIVLIEDNILLGNIIEKKLVSLGATVFYYRNGLEGLAGIRANSPDLVLLDIMLPVMNGYEVLEIMKVENLVDKHPVMIISNSGQPVEIERMRQLGAKDFLIKVDFTPNEVIEKATHIINSSFKKDSSVNEADKNGVTEDTENVPKVFVVEDDPMLRNILSRKLSMEHCTFMFTNDGTQAIELAQQYEPDVVILDLMLPGKDGFQILEEIKVRKILLDVPIIVFSNKSEPQDKERVLSLGATSYHIKAMTDLNDLVAEIKDMSDKKNR